MFQFPIFSKVLSIMLFEKLKPLFEGHMFVNGIPRKEVQSLTTSTKISLEKKYCCFFSII